MDTKLNEIFPTKKLRQIVDAERGRGKTGKKKVEQWKVQLRLVAGCQYDATVRDKKFVLATTSTVKVISQLQERGALKLRLVQPSSSPRVRRGCLLSWTLQDVKSTARGR